MFNVLNEAKKIREVIKQTTGEDLRIAVHHDNPAKHEGKIVLVFMNPSTGDDKDIETAEETKKGFKNWVNKKNKFYRTFFETLKEYLPGDYHFKTNNLEGEGFKTYVQDHLFEDFYVTDYVKLRTDTKTMRETLKLPGLKEEWDKLLQKEIELVKPNIVISFGANAWNSIRPLIDPYPSKAPVTQIHGDVFKLNNNIDYIPLAFVPGTSSYIKDSYFKYFIKGLIAMK
jgi:hypothetical protein